MPSTTTNQANTIAKALKGLTLGTDPILPPLVASLLEVKGQIISMVTVRPCRVLKGHEPITKQSEFNLRVGCDYDNLKAVKEKREDGTLPAENAGMWGEWVIFPYVKTHVPKGQTEREWYFRCTTLPGNIPKTFFFMGDKEITKDEAREHCLASEFRDSDAPRSDVFDVKVSSIVKINGKLV